MKRLALTLAYDGCRFDGWQTQPSRNTVQDHLERALARVADHAVATVCAGRTDAGVHASGQVVHFDTDAERSLNAWVRGVNSHMPQQIAVLSAQVVRDDFHARFDAIERRYGYWLYTSAQRHPFGVGRAGWVHRELDIEAMHQAAQILVGEHDYSAFRSSQCQANSPVRTINAIDVTRSGRMVNLRFSANAYLHHMIRNIVGTLVYIGDGRRPIAWAAEVLDSRRRAVAAPTFAPDGLYFESVRYPVRDAIAPAPQLPAGGFVPVHFARQ